MSIFSLWSINYIKFTSLLITRHDVSTLRHVSINYDISSTIIYINKEMYIH